VAEIDSPDQPSPAETELTRSVNYMSGNEGQRSLRVARAAILPSLISDGDLVNSSALVNNFAPPVITVVHQNVVAIIFFSF
jgi:hypothetical protein